MSRSPRGHNAACLWKGLDLSNTMCEYEVIGWLMKQLLEENETLTQIVTGRFHQSISRNLLQKIRLKRKSVITA